MRRYHADRFGMIASFDIAEALRRAEQRRRERELQERERADRARGLLGRVRALLQPPTRAAA